VFQPGIPFFLYKTAKNRRFHCKKELFCKLLGLFARFYVIFKGVKRVFALVLTLKSANFE
jgi:hypothetical protein